MPPTSQKRLCGQRLVATNLNRLLFSPTRSVRPLIYSYTLKISKRKIGHLKTLENFMILYIHSLSFPSEILGKCWQEIVCSVKHDLLYKRRSPFHQFQRYDFSCRELGSMGSWGKGDLYPVLSALPFNFPFCLLLAIFSESYVELGGWKSWTVNKSGLQ